jgi:hypothetical protein
LDYIYPGWCEVVHHCSIWTLYYVLTDHWYVFFYLLFWWGWGLNSGLCACKIVILLLKPHLQSILLWLFWR